MISKQSASMENYLQAIFNLQAENKPATVTEISRRLDVKKPSVVYALKELSRQKLVKYKKRRPVALSNQGNRLAANVFRRHEALRRFLIEILGVDPGIAEEDACKMEHFLSPVSLEKLDEFLKFMSTCPFGRPECLRGFDYYAEHGERPEELLLKCQ